MKRTILTSALLIGCAVLLTAQDTPKADLFLGYSFLRYHSAQTVPSFDSHGGLSSITFNFGEHLGLETELGGYHNGNIHNYHFDTTTFSFLFGPRLSVGRSKRIDPYFHVLFGGQHGTTSIAQDSILVVNPQASLSNGRYKASQTTFAMAAGGGLDIKLSRHVTFRPIQADYYLTRFEAPEVVVPTSSTLKTARNQNNYRFAAGLMFTFGGERAAPPPPPPPPKVTTKVCPDGSTIRIDEVCPKRGIGLGLTVDQSEVCAGTVVRIKPAGALPDGATNQWTVNGETINQAASLEFGTTGRAPGSYRIGLKVSAEGYQDASSETTVTVRGYQPPSGSLSASPAEIWVGEKSTLSANFRPGQCGGALRPASFAASEGSVSGSQYDSSNVAFDPLDNSEQRKTITIAAKVSDDQGSGSAQTQVVVKKQGSITAKRLPDVVFPPNSARVNNCGKRVLLEELKTYTDRDSTGNVVFVGHQGDSEKTSGLDLKRALNAAAVISAGQGICTAFPAAQIFLGGAGADQTTDFQPHFCGTSTDGVERAGQAVTESDETAKLRRVEVWFVPTNGKLPSSLKDQKDAASAGVSSLGCPR